VTASNNERRRHRKTGALLVGGALLALLLMRGSGWGLGSGGKSGKSGKVARRVRIRIDAAGITADGIPSTIDEAVETAIAAGAADVFVTGAARQGTFDDLIAALREAGVEVWIVGAHHD
jgi:hypothetical protein